MMTVLEQQEAIIKQLNAADESRERWRALAIFLLILVGLIAFAHYFPTTGTVLPWQD